MRMGLKIRFAHIEHAPTEALTEYVLGRAEKEMKFYQNLAKIAEKPNQERIKQFEDEHGSYEELISGEHVDHHITVAAVLSELKKRLGKRALGN